MKMTIAKLLSGFCWADVQLQAAAGEEAVQQGKGGEGLLSLLDSVSPAQSCF